MNESTGGARSASTDDAPVADRVTRWLIILIGIPVVLIAAGVLVGASVQFLLQAINFSAEGNLFAVNAIRVGVGVVWLGISLWLIRLMWPGPMFRHPG